MCFSDPFDMNDLCFFSVLLWHLCSDVIQLCTIGVKGVMFEAINDGNREAELNCI